MPSRVIRDGVLDSQRYHDVDKPARLAFLEILLCADDYGLVQLSDVYLKRHTTAFEGVPAQAKDGILQALVDVDLLRMYSTPDGGIYGYVPRFGNTPRAKKPKWPLPPDALGGNEIKHLVQKMHGRCSAPAVHLQTSVPETVTETETGTGTRASAKDISPQAKAAPPAEPAKTLLPDNPAPVKLKETKAEKAARATKCAPESFLVGPDLQRWARENFPQVDIRAETRKFRDYTFPRGIINWPGAWRNWITKAAGDLPRGAGGKSFRERDTEHAVAEASKWGGGRVAARPVPQADFLDMEQTHDVRIDGS